MTRTGPVLPNVSRAASWAVVPGQRCARDNSRDWSCYGPPLKSNVLTCGDALPCGSGHVREHGAKATRARKQAALASFLRWCRTHDLLDADPMATLERIAAPQRQPRGVDPARVQRVLDAIPRTRLRDRVLFGLIASTGLRASEALGVHTDDLSMATDDEHLSVVGKGDKQRTILLDDPALLALLRRYLGP